MWVWCQSCKWTFDISAFGIWDLAHFRIAEDIDFACARFYGELRSAQTWFPWKVGRWEESTPKCKGTFFAFALKLSRLQTLLPLSKSTYLDRKSLLNVSKNNMEYMCVCSTQPKNVGLHIEQTWLKVFPRRRAYVKNNFVVYCHESLK